MKLLINSMLFSKNPLKTNTIFWFVLNVASSLFLLYLTDHYLITRAMFQQSYSAQLDREQITQYFIQSRSVIFYDYPILILFLLMKYAIVAFILLIGADWLGYKVKFREMIKVVLVAELIFIVPALIRIYHFINAGFYSINDLRNYSGISLDVFFYGGGAGIWQYPLQTINIWEAGYWYLLAYGIKRLLGINLEKSLNIIFCSYIPALCFWLVLVAFGTFLMTV